MYDLLNYYCDCMHACISDNVVERRISCFNTKQYCTKLQVLMTWLHCQLSSQLHAFCVHVTHHKLKRDAFYLLKCTVLLHGEGAIPMQGPTPDVKLAVMGPNRLALLVHSSFVEASPTVEKAVSCYKADWLLASLLSFCSIQSSLSVCKFRATGKECCEQGHKHVCVWTFDA